VTTASDPTTTAPAPAGAAPPVRIQEFRLSFVQAETNDPPLGTDTRLRLYEDYEKAFEQAQRKDNPGPIYLPWKDQKTSFWKVYLGRTPRGNVSPFDAWKGLVPLRQSVPLFASAGWLKGNVSIIGYLYPFGQALVISATVTPGSDGITLDEMRQLALDVRNREFRLGTPAAGQDVRLPELLERGLNLLRAAATRPPAGPGLIGEVFSILTVVRGTGVTLPEPVPNPPIDSAMQKTLWAMTSGSQTSAVAPYEKTAVLPLKNQTSLHHVLYGSDRGRTVWFPEQFMDPVARARHSLGVYHRNLVACATQVESLCGLLESAARATSLTASALPLLRLAVGAVNRLYDGKKKSTYRTMSAKVQIARHSDFVESMNAVRDAINWGEAFRL
jgi:hypothetical protein